MTKRKTSGTGRTRHHDRPTRKLSTARGPNYLAHEFAQKFVPAQILVRAADLKKPRRTRS